MHSKSTALISKIFTVYSHHYGFSVIETLQNIFHKSHREITLNAKIIILFKNCRDVTQIACFLRQAFPERLRDVLNAYKDATSSPHGYFVVDQQPVPSIDFDTLLRSAVVKQEPSVPGWREFEEMLWESL